MIKAYLKELYRWNKKINLTSVEENEAMGNLVEPSLSMVDLFPSKEDLKVFDIGSGGGIPALILAIAMPKNSFYLIESVTKKCTILQHMAIALSLNNLNIINDRTEKIMNNSTYKNSADVVTSRQVKADTVFKIADFLLKSDGSVIIHRPLSEEIQQDGFRKNSRCEFADRFVKSNK